MIPTILYIYLFWSEIPADEDPKLLIDRILEHVESLQSSKQSSEYGDNHYYFQWR